MSNKDDVTSGRTPGMSMRNANQAQEDEQIFLG